MVPLVAESTRDERLAYVREHYRCISDCDQCGLCQIFHGVVPEHALEAYINGEEELKHVMMALRRR